MDGCCIPTLKTLTILRVPSLTKGAWIHRSEFLNFLEKNWKTGDQTFRKHNIRAELERNDGTWQYEDLTLISFERVITFLFMHQQNYKICDVACSEIRESLLNSLSPPMSTEESLYDTLASSPLKQLEVETVLLQNVSFSNPIPTLNIEYESRYSIEEWKRIKHFELHFSREYETFERMSYEETILRKWQFHRRCTNMADTASYMQLRLRQFTAENSRRMKSAEQVDDMHFVVENTKHIPTIIEQDIVDRVKGDFRIDVAVSCTQCKKTLCKHPPGVHVILELCTEMAVTNINTSIQSILNRRHNTWMPDLTILGHKAFEPYRYRKTHLQRLKLRDDLLAGKLHIVSYQYFRVSPDQRGKPDDDSMTFCFTCCAGMVDNPLSWKSMNIMEEWTLNVPLLMQILLEGAINKNSIASSKNVDKLVAAKINKLYLLMEILSHILNKKYFGPLQEMCTLLIHTHHRFIHDTFSITNLCSLTKSIRSAEGSLQIKANPDYCYQKAYLSVHKLEYERIGKGIATYEVCMLDCITILFTDNLVRLTIHADPNPGESRTSQICTLPITLKGLPRDSSVTESWHNESCTDKTSGQACPCMKSTVLDTSDMTKFTELNEDEKKIFDYFKGCAVWHLAHIYETIKKDDVMRSIINDAICQSPESNDDRIEDMLNTTLTNLTLTEPDDLQEESDENDDGDEDDDEQLEHDLETFLAEMLSTEGINAVDDEDIPTSDCEMEDSTDSETTDHEGDVNNFDIEGVQTFSSDDEETSEIELPRGLQTTEQSTDGSSHDEMHTRVDTSQESLPILETSEIIRSSETNIASTDDTNTIIQWEMFNPPPLLCRHPYPNYGRDDDPKKIKEIMDNHIEKMGYSSGYRDCDKVLTAPDNKISKSVLKLKKISPKYKKFICEFPILHLKKSKIINLCSGYKQGGLAHIMKFMFDNEEEKDFMKLVDIRHIEKAAKNIRRLCMSIEFAFLIFFMQSLSHKEATELDHDLSAADIDKLISKWNGRYCAFIKNATETNATVALHDDIKKHCEEIVAISLAERLGGPQGYKLLLAAVKSSLPFAFVNNASSYAVFCVDLLHEHYIAGPFFTNLKVALFSFKHRHSDKNSAQDAHREEDNMIDVKGFHDSSTKESVLGYISRHDDIEDARRVMDLMLSFKEDDDTMTASVINENASPNSYLIWDVSEKDIVHVKRTSALIYAHGLSATSDEVVTNAYSNERTVISDTILDKNSYPVGTYLTKRYIQREGYLGLNPEQDPLLKLTEPKALIRRVKVGKSVTVNRTTCKPKTADKKETGRQKKERQRKVNVAKQAKYADNFSSEMNACMALAKPDCSKKTVQKSAGVVTALTDLLEKTDTNETVILKNVKNISKVITENIVFVTFEFAGVKFKANAGAKTGQQYLETAENIVTKITDTLPQLRLAVLCEEKYRHTPDVFKGQTRDNRRKAKSAPNQTIVHLKPKDEKLSWDKMNKKALVTTMEGKKLASVFIADNLNKLKFRNLVVIMDSDKYVEGCTCNNDADESCTCDIYSIPEKVTFDENGYKTEEKLDLQQRKGEGEMAQVDWLLECGVLAENEAVVSILTSGDIDSVPIHMFALSLHWQRKENSTFSSPVYVYLQKMSPDLYCITAIIELLETRFGHYGALKIAILLCMGGNDYLPKFQGITHKTLLNTAIENNFVQSLIILEGDPPVSGKLNEELYIDLVKIVYCPKDLDPNLLSFDVVRQISVKRPKKNAQVRGPDRWMPPRTALLQVAKLVNSQIEYFFGLFHHDAKLPDFLSNGGLKAIDGVVGFDFGPDCHVSDISEICTMPEEQLKEMMALAKTKQKKAKKRTIDTTPQKGARMKSRRSDEPKTSTPRKKTALHSIQDESDPTLYTEEPSHSNTNVTDDNK